MADRPADKGSDKDRDAGSATSRGTSHNKCPVCGRPSEPRYAPFCSRRCADVDLARWLSGAYAIPDTAESEDGDESKQPSERPDKAETPDRK